MACNGWGLSDWGESPWGGGDQKPPVIASIAPACGSTGVSIHTPIVITVCDDGCSGLAIDCIRIYVNGALIYSGAGLTIGTIDDGFLAPCAEACSDVTVNIDPITGQTCFVFNICCTPFDCGTSVTVNGTFCNEAGEVVAFADCAFVVNSCNYIENIEIIDRRHIVVRFSNRMLPNPILNGALYDPGMWSVIPVSGGFLESPDISVRNVLVEKTFLPKTVILETSPLTRGAMYEVVGDPTILDIFKQPLESIGKANVLGRHTQVDKLLEKLPRMYKKLINSDVEDDIHVISIWQILASIGIEDERMGGNY